MEMHVIGYDDWQGLFVDDQLEAEGHEVTLRDLVLASHGEAFTLTTDTDNEAAGSYLEVTGSFMETYLPALLERLGDE